MKRSVANRSSHSTTHSARLAVQTLPTSLFYALCKWWRKAQTWRMTYKITLTSTVAAQLFQHCTSNTVCVSTIIFILKNHWQIQVMVFQWLHIQWSILTTLLNNLIHLSNNNETQLHLNTVPFNIRCACLYSNHSCHSQHMIWALLVVRYDYALMNHSRNCTGE